MLAAKYDRHICFYFVFTLRDNLGHDEWAMMGWEAIKMERLKKIPQAFEELDEVINELPAAIQTRLRLSLIFRSIHQKMNEGISFEEILNSVFTSLHSVIPFDRIGIALLEHQDKIIRLKWVKSKTSEKWLTRDHSENIKENILWKVFETDTPLIIDDFKEYLKLHPYSMVIKLLLREGMNSGMSCPLRIEGRTIGVISFTNSAPKTYDFSHIDLFSEISQGLSIIVEKELLKQSMTKSTTQQDLFKNYIHDLNNPLNIIHASLTLMEGKSWFKELGEDFNKTFSMLKRNCDSMINIIRSVIYERSNIPKNSLGIDKHLLREFILEIASDCEALGQSKGIKTSAIIGPNVPVEAEFNYFVLKDVVHNLIANAVKFSPRGSKIIIKEDFNTEAGRLSFTVTDEGPGIPITEHNKLFKQFGKTSVQSTAGEPSSGLGLANVKRLVESQNGQVFVDSNVGQGSTFGFWIPIFNPK
jgi:signal transduction histidine kinase